MIRQDGTGFSTFKVKYTAVVCRPFKGEIIDCTVQSVNKVRGGGERGAGWVVAVPTAHWIQLGVAAIPILMQLAHIYLAHTHVPPFTPADGLLR